MVKKHSIFAPQGWIPSKYYWRLWYKHSSTHLPSINYSNNNSTNNLIKWVVVSDYHNFVLMNRNRTFRFLHKARFSSKSDFEEKSGVTTFAWIFTDRTHFSKFSRFDTFSSIWDAGWECRRHTLRTQLIQRSFQRARKLKFSGTQDRFSTVLLTLWTLDKSQRH